ncbi:hypothetical protein Hypma_004516 [Hypsizygus marmoreus]|uniref:Uncharacterized protein n=1 Tax=Hypsizygus marmoreus TaxID=39966 RepID=A0A369K3P2_HYPMA|nr:hypothetical protein Hypma_004516 [Hypsizygus marmoreus]
MLSFANDDLDALVTIIVNRKKRMAYLCSLREALIQVGKEGRELRLERLQRSKKHTVSILPWDPCTIYAPDPSHPISVLSCVAIRPNPRLSREMHEDGTSGGTPDLDRDKFGHVTPTFDDPCVVENVNKDV